MLENILQSLQSVWSHKLRSFLTMLGVIIGIASIITIVATIKGTNDQIKENLVGSGTNAVGIAIDSDTEYYDPGYSAVPEGVTPVTEESRQALLELDGVSDATVFHRIEYSSGVYRLQTSFNGNLIGADSHYFDVYSYELLHGRLLTEKDSTSFRKVAVLDDDAVKTLFPEEDPLGKTLEIFGEPFTVVGIVAQSSDFQPVIENMNDYYTYVQDGASGGTVFLPDGVWPVVFSFDMPDYVAVKAESTDDMTKAGTAAADYLTEHHTSGSAFTYRSTDVLELASQIQSLSGSANSQLIWIAGISLLVGGIGVMNIMLVSVTERTREIGLRKAIGAKRRRILLQFLTEAAVLTSMGGILGVLAGLGLAKAFTALMGIPASVSVQSAVIAVAFSMVIGILFGLIPAWKASKLNPIEALRRE